VFGRYRVRKRVSNRVYLDVHRRMPWDIPGLPPCNSLPMCDTPPPLHIYVVKHRRYTSQERTVRSSPGVTFKTVYSTQCGRSELCKLPLHDSGCFKIFARNRRKVAYFVLLTNDTWSTVDRRLNTAALLSYWSFEMTGCLT